MEADAPNGIVVTNARARANARICIVPPIPLLYHRVDPRTGDRRLPGPKSNWAAGARAQTEPERDASKFQVESQSYTPATIYGPSQSGFPFRGWVE
jgi:hypothetical protein